jgi:hypothetical protein
VSSLRRPWTQGEIGDFVRANFAAEIAQRSAQIASAVRAGADRHVMPLISQPDDDTTEIDDDTEEFGQISSEISETPVDVRHLHRPSAERIAVDEPGEPPPNLGALRAVPAPVHAPQPPIVVVNRRSVVWPLLAFAMVVVAGGALFLVWRQMQTPGTTLVIDHGPGVRVDKAGSDVVDIGPREPAAVPGGPSPSSKSAELSIGAPGDHGGGAAPSVETPRGATARVPADRHRPAGDPYQDLVKARKPEADRCTTHDKLPPGTSMEIVIGPDGHPRSVTLAPAAVDDTPLGACIRKVFRSVTFPRADRDVTLNVGLLPG